MTLPHPHRRKGDPKPYGIHPPHRGAFASEVLVHGEDHWVGWAVQEVASGRLVLWKGSKTPRIFVEEEAAGFAVNEGHQLVAVHLTVIVESP